MFEVKIIHVDAEKKAVPVIKIRSSLKNSELYMIDVLGYKIDITFSGVAIGNISNFTTIRLDSKGSNNFDEEIQITPYIFEAIDKTRNHGDISVSGYISCLYAKVLDNRTNPTPQVFKQHFDSYKLSQLDWINLASKLGYTKYKLFELEWPDIPQLDNLTNIIKGLEEAQSLFYEGKNNEVVSKCRLVLEELMPVVTGKYSNNKLEMKKEISSIIDIGSFQKEGEDPKSVKVENMRQNIWKYHHIGPHYGYTVTREDAELSILLCLAMVRYYSAHLNKLSDN